jgi:hypothetical protein
MKNRIDFSEIENDEAFENLVAAYFRDYFASSEKVRGGVSDPSRGPDGGKDMKIQFRSQYTDVFDGSLEVERKWIVQCKFNQISRASIGLKDLATVNIPTLIHSENADGYLLVCVPTVSSSVDKMFQELEKNCKFRYKYRFWTQDFFREQLLNSSESLYKLYFPEYFDHLISKGSV